MNYLFKTFLSSSKFLLEVDKMSLVIQKQNFKLLYFYYLIIACILFYMQIIIQ